MHTITFDYDTYGGEYVVLIDDRPTIYTDTAKDARKWAYYAGSVYWPARIDFGSGHIVVVKKEMDE